MKTNKFITFIYIIILSVISVYASEYHNVTSKVDFFDYSGFTFTYIEDGIEKTARLTDEALTPAHQMALLKEIYTNPNIPGIHYGYDYNGTQTRKIDYDYYGKQKTVADSTFYWLGDDNDYYPNPYQDGMTVLLVQLTNTWETKNHSKMKTVEEYFRNAVKSIKLMHNFVRINDPDNPGYMFSVDASVNRFFFISKGKSRSTYTRPFYRMFEQISPVNVNDTIGGNTSFIDEIRTGHIYYCYHDCVNVFNWTGTDKRPHWFTIANNGETYDIKNLTVFLSDRRFEYEQDTYSDYINNTNYNEYGNGQNPGEENWEIMPRAFLYDVALSVNMTVCEDNEDYVNIKLDWNSETGGLDIPEHFWVYQTDGYNMELLSSVHNQPVTSKNHSYRVKRLPDVQEFSYVVVGAPILYDNNGNIRYDNNGNPLKTISATSNIVKVTIPGKDPYFSQAASVRSRYEIDNEINIYKNVLTISPTTRADYESIKNNTDIFNITRDDNQGNKITIATIQYTQKLDLSGYDYIIAYNTESQDLVNLFDNEQPVTSGAFSAYDESSINIIDRFSASTAMNSHPAKYTYTMEQPNGNYSNAVDINVFKTTNSIESYGFTQEEITDDIDRSLEQFPATAVTFDVINDPYANLVEYGIYAIDNNNNIKKVCKAENANNDGIYVIYTNKTNEALDEITDNITIGQEGGQITVIDYNKSALMSMTYVPVIKTSFNVALSEYNTYGCEKKSISYPTVNGGIKTRNNKQQLYITDIYEGPEGFYRTYVAEIYITPKLTHRHDMVYKYRVWRDNGDKDNGWFTYLDQETLLDDVDDVSGISIDEYGNPVNWASDYSKIHELYPGNKQVTFTDLFIDKAIITNNDRKTVYYYIRMYAMPSPSAPAHLNKKNIDNDRIYVIGQTKVTARFTTTSVITETDNIYNDNKIKNTVYYNTLGISSNKPFKGVNIKITVFIDGTVKSEKILFPEN